MRLLPPDDLLHDATYRRLFASILSSSFGGQITMLALPLTAALLLNATPSQMGLLAAIEYLPFVLFSLPAGVWLDRLRKLPLYIGGEASLAVAVASVPLGWWLGWLTMPWLYAVGFVIGMVNTLSGSAAQVLLTQVVPRERLVEAHARNTLASSSSEVMGPGIAGVLVKLLGAPVTLLFDAGLLCLSCLILGGVRVQETLPPRPAGPGRRFLDELRVGLRFVRGQRLLVAMAAVSGSWHLSYNTALAVAVLHGSRGLGLSERALGLCYVGVGVGAVLASLVGHRLSRRIGPGPAMLTGSAICGLGWLGAGWWSSGPAGVAAFAAMQLCFGLGGSLMFINFIAMRQAVTPSPLLGRMTSTMRWLIVLPAGPGALLGGLVGERVSLPAALLVAGMLCLLLTALAWRLTVVSTVKVLPAPEAHPLDAQSAQATP